MVYVQNALHFLLKIKQFIHDGFKYTFTDKCVYIHKCDIPFKSNTKQYEILNYFINLLDIECRGYTPKPIMRLLRYFYENGLFVDFYRRKTKGQYIYKFIYVNGRLQIDGEFTYENKRIVRDIEKMVNQSIKSHLTAYM